MASGSRSATVLPSKSSVVRLVRLRNYPSADAWMNRKGCTLTETTRLAPGAKAPAFSLPDADGKKVSLADYKGRRVVGYFYPAASTPRCTQQACAFRDSLSELNGAGLDVVGISPDKPGMTHRQRSSRQTPETQ